MGQLNMQKQRTAMVVPWCRVRTWFGGRMEQSVVNSTMPLLNTIPAETQSSEAVAADHSVSCVDMVLDSLLHKLFQFPSNVLLLHWSTCQIFSYTYLCLL